jgi:hypothetical protein
MERQRYSDEDLVEREIEEQTENPEPSQETEFDPAQDRPSLHHDEENDHL